MAGTYCLFLWSHLTYTSKSPHQWLAYASLSVHFHSPILVCFFPLLMLVSTNYYYFSIAPFFYVMSLWFTATFDLIFVFGFSPMKLFIYSECGFDVKLILLVIDNDSNKQPSYLLMLDCK